jgi:hypothetical protein
MKLGVFTVLFSVRSRSKKCLTTSLRKGLEAVEIGTGGYPGDAHCNRKELLADESKRKAYLKAVESRG